MFMECSLRGGARSLLDEVRITPRESGLSLRTHSDRVSRVSPAKRIPQMVDSSERAQVKFTTILASSEYGERPGSEKTIVQLKVASFSYQAMVAFLTRH